MLYALRLPDTEEHPQQVVDALVDCGFTIVRQIHLYILLGTDHFRERWGNDAPDPSHLLALTGGKYWLYN